MGLQTLYKWLAALIILGLFVVGGNGASASPATVNSTPEAYSKPKVAETDDGLYLEWIVPDAEIMESGSGTVRIEIPGFSQLKLPGAPIVPVAYALIALPPNAQPQLEIEVIEERTIPLPGELALAHKPEGVLKNAQGEVIGGAFVTPKQAAPFQPEVLELEILGVMRGVSLARIAFFPIRPNGYQLRLATRVGATVHYNAPSFETSGVLPSADPLHKTLKSQVLNPDQVQTTTTLTTMPDRRLDSPIVEGEVAIIEVSQRGITEITYLELTEIDFPVESVNTDNLHLFHSGNEVGDDPIEVAIQWDGDTDQSFETGERILFYADPRFSRWTKTDTYLLYEGDTSGSRIQSRSADPTGLEPGNAYVEKIEEQNILYTPDCYCGSLPAGRDGDHWAWDKIAIPYGGSISRSYIIDLPTVDNTKNAALKLWLIGYTDVKDNPDHHVEVRLNTHLLSPVIDWNGKQTVEQELNIPAGILINGTNTVELTLPGIVNVEGMYLDAYAVDYSLGDSLIQGSLYFTGEQSQRSYTILFREAGDPPNFMAYDVTNPENPIILTDVDIQPGSYPHTTVADTSSGEKHAYFFTGEDYLLSHEGMHKKATLSNSNADYVIISHSNFIPALTPLINLRQVQGKNVAVFDVHTIYDNYNAGKQQPEAIHAFLENAYHNWALPPLYVLLVGDGTSDPKHYDLDSTITYIPPFLVNVDPWVGETASDNRYVTVDGDDILPDILIGRLPVNSLSKASTIVDKIVNYETTPPEGDWRQKVTFVADNADDPDSSTNNFPEDAIYLDNNYIPPQYSVNHIHHPQGGDPNLTRIEIRNTWNSGTVLLTYLGHGAIKRWGAHSEGFWEIGDLASLSNGVKLPVVLEMTCLTGKFQAREDDTLDESTLRLPNSGAVAVWGPTGLGLATGHVELAEGFYTEIFSNPTAVIGQATLAGKLNLMQNKPSYSDLVDTFVLFGDPATQIKLTWSNYTFIPLVFR